MTPHLCMHNAQNKQADAKIFDVSFTFATQKLAEKTPKHFANSSSFQHWYTLAFLFIYPGFRNIQTRSLHSVVCFHLTINITLITSSASTSEQTNKSSYKSEK